MNEVFENERDDSMARFAEWHFVKRHTPRELPSATAVVCVVVSPLALYFDDPRLHRAEVYSFFLENVVQN